MEFKDKLQKLRKNNNYTQEELAEKLFVSRTAISKWETGRGYPNLESLQSISNIFEISINDLLSSEEIIIASKNEKKKIFYFYTFLIFVFLDLLVILSIFLPLYGNVEGSKIVAVNLINYEIPNYMKVIYYGLFLGQSIGGIIEIIIYFIKRDKMKIIFISSIIFEILSLIFLIASMQPYASVFILFLLIAKVGALYLLKMDK